MNTTDSTPARTLFIVAGLLVAAAAGYGIARLAVPGVAPAVSPAATAGPPGELKIADPALTLMGISVEAALAGDLAAEVQAPGTVSSTTTGQAIVAAQQGVDGRGDEKACPARGYVDRKLLAQPLRVVDGGDRDDGRDADDVGDVGVEEWL